MKSRYFFVTTYDDMSGSFIADLLNLVPEIHCSHSTNKLVPGINKLEKNHTSIDDFIKIDTNVIKEFSGNVQLFPAFLLQHKSLIEKTKHPFRKTNIAMSPELRIKSLLKSWKKIFPQKLTSLNDIGVIFSTLGINSSDIFALYNFRSIYNDINQQANKYVYDRNHTDNILFLIAIAVTITMDTADLPTPGKIYSYEKLLNEDNESYQLINYLTDNKTQIDQETLSAIDSLRIKKRKELEQTFNETLENWQLDLINYYLFARLKTIYYPHISQPLSYFYNENGYSFHQPDHHDKYTKLISIQLNSNRPSQLTAYFDNIEETVDDPTLIEVLVNIDDNDVIMESTLKREVKKRRFTIKYIKTERPASFCDLWKPINQLLYITDPNAYFLLNISDEMLFKTVGWDSILKKYVGFFPDDLFRLRASRNKYRNYFDRWECSFTQDSIPITTKKWIDIGGDWNPCFGPDSFQQLVSFYLAKDAVFSNENYLRDVPLIDIKFHGDVPAMGIQPEKAWKHNSEHIKAMEICQSYKMQKEAKRRAMLIKAYIIAYNNQLDNYKITVNKAKSDIYLTLNTNKNVVKCLNYNLSFVSISIVNYLRRFYFHSYFGDGLYAKNHLVKGFIRYLKSKYRIIYTFSHSRIILSKAKHKINHLIKRSLTKILNRKTNNILQENLRLKGLYQEMLIENEKLKSILIEYKTKIENTPISSENNIKVLSR